MVGPAAKTGTLGRGLRIGKLGFSLVGSYLGYQAQNLILGKSAQPERRTRFHQQASKKVREELGALKGPAMKLGQVLSMQNDFLSEEALQELATLQMHAPPMHATLARAQFKSALGKDPEDLFREFDPVPFAAASLGQVHRAVTFQGEKVAVKIQYPAIRSAIEDDLKLLRSVTLPTRLTGHVPAALVDEIQRGLLEETDYVREADSLEYFRKGLAGLPHVTVPRVYRELSSDRVLTMSFVEGESLATWLKRRPSQAQRNLMAERLGEIYETQLQWLRMLHADQHPGNYLFRPDGHIGLVDFGCVKRITFDVEDLRRCYRERTWRQSEAAARQFLRMVYGPGVPYARARKILPVLEKFMDIHHPPNANEDWIIDFDDHAKEKPGLKEARRQYQKQLLQDRLINPEFVFFMRADMGLLHLLHELRATLNVTKLISRVAAMPPPGWAGARKS